MRKLIYIVLLTAGCMAMAQDACDESIEVDVVDLRLGDQLPDNIDECELVTGWHVSEPGTKPYNVWIFACDNLTDNQ